MRQDPGSNGNSNLYRIAAIITLLVVIGRLCLGAFQDAAQNERDRRAEQGSAMVQEIEMREKLESLHVLVAEAKKQADHPQQPAHAPSKRKTNSKEGAE